MKYAFDMKILPFILLAAMLFISCGASLTGTAENRAAGPLAESALDERGGAFLYGDVNGDGSVNKKDSLALKKYLADSTYPIDLTAADVNDDGAVNKKDSLRLKQYLAGWEVTLGPEEPAISLSEEDMALYEGSYGILKDRITDRGYAITSLTGTYVGMFTRDSSIQAMAHIANGESDKARAILRYLLSCHAHLGLQRGTHIIDELREETYRNDYLNGSGEETPENVYDSQTSPGVAQFLLNAPNNTSATPFVTQKRTVSSVQAYLEGVKNAKVVAEICTDFKDASTTIGRGEYVFDSASPGFKTIELESAVTLTPGETYYLKLYAPAGNGRVVWYGVNSGSTGWKKAWNYDLAAYGGNGWREVEVYTAFIIGEGAQQAETYSVQQRNAEIAIYCIQAPNNGAAQAFIPKNDKIYSVEAHLGKTKNGDTVKASIRTDYKNEATTVAEKEYTFGTHESGWQHIDFDEPVTVTPGATYYLVLQTTGNSGRVVWNGTTGGEGLNSYNYDVPSFGGWVEKPYHLAFEVLSFPTGTVAQSFTARGTAVGSVDIDLFAAGAGAVVTAGIYENYADPTTLLGRAQATVEETGETTCKLYFENGIAVQKGRTYDLVVSFTGTDDAVRVLTDASAAADSYALGEEWMRVGYDFLARVGFEVDAEVLFTLDGSAAAVQEIPAKGETVTSVRVLLSKDAGTTGKLRATLTKGEGTAAQTVGERTIDCGEIPGEAGWVTLAFDLPLFKQSDKGSYFLRLEVEDAAGKVYWHGSTTVDHYATYTLKNGAKQTVSGEAGFEALRGILRLISDYTQTDTTYMLLHAWAMFVRENDGTPEDLAFIEQSYPLIRNFANYYLDTPGYYEKSMKLLYNPSLEHSRKGRYWQAYDLITNVFASQALHELSSVAENMNDTDSAEKWSKYAENIKDGIYENLVTEYDGKTIYGEYYDKEDNMKFYPGISWVNFAPVAAEWYAMDAEIMKNTYEVYKDHAGIKIFGFDGLATDATLGTDEIRREFIGKGVAWELMFCNMIGDTERVEKIMELELYTANRYHLSTYPESWIGESYVSDPGNQEHVAWQVYAVSRVFGLKASE